MSNYELDPQDHLDLSWPHSADYHVDDTRHDASGPRKNCEAGFSATSSSRPVTTYNVVPRDLLRDAQPLYNSEIRVLDLQKGTPGMPLLGSLRKVLVSGHDEFQPLSYTWEDGDTVESSYEDSDDDVHPAVFVADTDCYLDLTMNCARALSSVRKPTADRTIWIDSICVNQDDPEERSRQVDLMKEIYSRAFTVLLYLGPGSARHDGSRNLAMALLSQPGRLQQPGQLHEREVASLKRLFERHYFRRMWIVQEAALAETLEMYCDAEMSYVFKFARNPLEAILGSRVTQPWLKHSKQTAADLSKPRVASQAEQILGLLFDTALCDCQDDRDKIFALFSLLKPNGEERLRADYTLSTAQVYSGIAGYLASNSFVWRVLMLARRLALSNCITLVLASWVPGWNNIGGSGPQSPQRLEKLVSWSRTLAQDTLSSISSSGGITIRGILLGPATNLHWLSHDHLFRDDYMTEDEGLVTNLFPSERELGSGPYNDDSSSIWTLARLDDEGLSASWGFHMKFVSASGYTLVEIGVPQVRMEVPEHWKVDPDVVPHLHLSDIQPVSCWKESHWDTLLYSKQDLPRLSEYPELWSYNPLSKSMTLTHTAMYKIRHMDVKTFSKLQSWQEGARACVPVFRDQARLRLLIDEAKSLPFEDYNQILRTAAMGPEWTLAHFLLFVNDTFNEEPVTWPNAELLDDPAPDGRPVLLHLMQWAQDTHSLLWLSSKRPADAMHWLKLPTDRTIHGEAVRVANHHVRVAGVVTRGDDGLSRGQDRSLLLLMKMLRQLSDGPDSAPRKASRQAIEGECYWDWRVFNSTTEKWFAFLGHIQPKVESIQKKLHDFRPDFKLITAYQVAAAHGFDPRARELTEIKLR